MRKALLEKKHKTYSNFHWREIPTQVTLNVITNGLTPVIDKLRVISNSYSINNTYSNNKNNAKAKAMNVISEK